MDERAGLRAAQRHRGYAHRHDARRSERLDGTHWQPHHHVNGFLGFHFDVRREPLARAALFVVGIPSAADRNRVKRTRETWIGLTIVAVTVLFNAIVLAPELSVGRVDLNDSVFHLTI